MHIATGGDFDAAFSVSCPQRNHRAAKDQIVLLHNYPTDECKNESFKEPIVHAALPADWTEPASIVFLHHRQWSG